MPLRSHQSKKYPSRSVYVFTVLGSLRRDFLPRNFLTSSVTRLRLGSPSCLTATPLPTASSVACLRCMGLQSEPIRLSRTQGLSFGSYCAPFCAPLLIQR